MRPLTAALIALVALVVPANAPAVVGGAPATPGAHPHIGSLRVDDGEAGSDDFVCGASLIAPTWVLTAAHCLVTAEGPGPRATAGVDPARVSVGLGSYERTGPAETIAAAEVIVNDRYGQPAENSNDVALVRLVRAATKATPIRLATPAEQDIYAPGRQTTVVGWGTAFFPDVGGLTVREDLQQVSVPRVSDEAAALSYQTDALNGQFDPQTMLAAGNLSGLEDSCQGDSGGPLTVPDREGRLAQIGVVSFGFGCGFPTQYGIYARVADTPLYGWIVTRTGATPPAPDTGTASPALRASPDVRARHAHVGRRRLAFTLSAGTALRDVSLRVTRSRGGRRITVAAGRLRDLRATRRVVLRLRVRPATARSLLRIALTATDASGRRVSAVLRARGRTHR
ncbi:MAG: serine protease [Solirubrobacterales bacterium]|nr:serine protease [Solirubrobacterales bacterium]